MPEVPQSAAGLRVDPHVSDPVPPMINPAAMALALPLLEPEVERSGFHGFRAGGHGISNGDPHKANSYIASFPSITVPACANRVTTVASELGT
jgi:hypothetical protein